VLFDSFTFLVFFTIVLFFHRVPLPWAVKKVNPLAASYVLYAAWNPPSVVLL
jgi:alginate O-acetyltransferase complex protein AlgI